MEFQKFKLEDLDKLNKILQVQPYKCCDYSLYIIYAWANYYSLEYAFVENGLILKSKYENEDVYSLPLNVNDFEKYIDYKNFFICEDELNAIKDKYDLEVIPLRDSFDYIYDIEQLSYLKGKKNNKLRNHVNRFNIENKDHFKISEININDKENISNFLEEYREKDNYNETYNFDIEKVKEFFNNYDLFSKYFYSYKLEIDNKLCGIVSGEIIQDTLFIHILKCYKQYSGIFHFLNNYFCKVMYERFNNLKYVNREDDTGDEGIRKTKLQYHPISFIEKYKVKML